MYERHRPVSLDEAELTIMELSEENADLKEKVHKLRRQVLDLSREVDRLRQSAVADLPEARVLRRPTPTPVMGADEAATRRTWTTPVDPIAHAGGAAQTPWRGAPSQPLASPSGPYSRSTDQTALADFLNAEEMSSTMLGRPLTAQEAQAAPQLAPPEPSAVPGFDLGYINTVTEEQLDSLPFGLIVLDEEGTVLLYNETESKLTGFRRERILGRNFFVDIAPCTRVKEFEGRFQQFVRGELGRVTFFDFAFHFSKGTQQVLIGFSHGRQRGQVNIMMMRRKPS